MTALILGTARTQLPERTDAIRLQGQSLAGPITLFFDRDAILVSRKPTAGGKSRIKGTGTNLAELQPTHQHRRQVRYDWNGTDSSASVWSRAKSLPLHGTDTECQNLLSIRSRLSFKLTEVLLLQPVTVPLTQLPHYLFHFVLPFAWAMYAYSLRRVDSC